MAKKGRQRAPVARALSVPAVVEDDAPVPVAEEAVLVAEKAADNTVLVFDSAKLGLKFIKKTMPLTITGLTPGGVAAKRFGVELSEGMQVVAIASASATPRSKKDMRKGASTDWQPFEGLRYEEAVDIMKTTPRPISLMFRSSEEVQRRVAAAQLFQRAHRRKSKQRGKRDAGLFENPLSTKSGSSSPISVDVFATEVEVGGAGSPKFGDFMAQIGSAAQPTIKVPVSIRGSHKHVKTSAENVRSCGRQRMNNIRQRMKDEMEEAGAGSKSPMLHPNSPTVKVWKCMEAVAVIFLVLELPYRITFVDHVSVDDEVGYRRREAYHDYVLYFDYLIDVIFIADVLFYFNVCYYEATDANVERLVVSRLKVAINRMFPDEEGSGKRRFRATFIYDVVSALPLDTMIRIGGQRTFSHKVRMIRYLRVLHMEEAYQPYTNLLAAVGNLVPVLDPIIQLVSISILLSLFNHVMACMLFFSGRTELDEPDCDVYDNCGWVSRQDWQDTNATHTYRYVTAFYYAFTIVTSVGFGDISPKGQYEMIIVVIVQVLGCFCFGIVLGSISSMIQGSNMGKLAYDEIYQEVMQYMRYRKVSHLVRHQVHEYFVQMFPNRLYFDERKILTVLPASLRKELLMDSYGELIGDLPFVPNTTDANKHDEALLFRHKIVQEAICECACPCTYMPHELIVIEGEVGSSMFVISTGKVEVKFDEVDKDNIVLYSGQFFGELSNLMPKEAGQHLRRGATCVAVTLVSAIMFRRCDMDNIRHNYEELDNTIHRYLHFYAMCESQGRDPHDEDDEDVKRIRTAAMYSPYTPVPKHNAKQSHSMMPSLEEAEDSERGGIKAAQMLAMFSRLELQMDAMSTQLAHVERKLELQSTADT